MLGTRIFYNFFKIWKYAARAIFSNLNVALPHSIKVRPPPFKSLGTGMCDECGEIFEETQ